MGIQRPAGAEELARAKKLAKEEKTIVIYYKH